MRTRANGFEYFHKFQIELYPPKSYGISHQSEAFWCSFKVYLSKKTDFTQLMKDFYSDFSIQSLQKEVSVPLEDFDCLNHSPFASKLSSKLHVFLNHI